MKSKTIRLPGGVPAAGKVSRGGPVQTTIGLPEVTPPGGHLGKAAPAKPAPAGKG